MTFMRFALVTAALSALVLHTAEAQRELLPAPDPVYEFLQRQEMKGNIRGFQWGMLPLSRQEISGYLDTLGRCTNLTATDQDLLRDYRMEFSYERLGTTDSSSSFLPEFGLNGIFDDQRQKHLYMSADSSTSLFFEGFGSYSYRAGKGDSVGSVFASLGEIGFRLRGTLFHRGGYYLEASNGRLFSGSHQFADLDPRLLANKKFNTDQAKFFDITKGYFRYDADWLAVTIGREQILWGMGYADRLMFSDNTVPFDYIRLDLRSGNLHYSFLHGGLVGADTNGQTLSSKYIAAHRLEFNIGSRVRLGLSEAIIYSYQPPIVALMNPLAFLTSTELSTEIASGSRSSNEHNSLIWIDAEVKPAENLRLSGSWLIDDIDFSALGKSNIAGNTNKFGWQAGILWNDALTVGNLLLDLEYTRIGPFVGTHRTIVNSFTNWSLPLGAELQPNSDEWLIGADYDVTSRLRASGRLRFQRTGENIVDAAGNIVYNVGSDLLHGEGDLAHPNIFLDGRRVNRTLASLQLTWQPVWQYFVDLTYFYRSFRYPQEHRTLNDSILWTTLRIDY